MKKPLPTFVVPVTDKPAKYYVAFEGNCYPVDSLKVASAKWREFRDRVSFMTGAGASVMPEAYVLDSKGNVIGNIAYNGRIFEGLPHEWTVKTRILYDTRRKENE